jgi:hypothetical protein
MKKKSASVRLLPEQWADGERLSSLPAGQKHYTPGELGEPWHLARSDVRGLISDKGPESGGGWVLPPTSAINSNTSQSSWLIDDKQAAVLLGVAPATLRSWRCRGIGPAYVKFAGLRGGVRYDVSDIAEYTEQCRHTPSVRAAFEGK